MTKLQKHYAAVAGLGCLACRKNGYETPAELHHPFGRVGKKAFMVIPLCANHHRGGNRGAICISVHPWKRLFEEKHGSEIELLAEVERLLK